jgi:CRP-like cAMP-binding protein
MVEQQLKKFFSKYPSHTYKKTEVLLRPNNIPQGIFYIKSGYIRMYQIFEGGKELTLNIFKPGSYFPVSFAISNLPNKYYFEAITVSTLNLAPKEKVTILLKSNPEILFELTNRLVVGFYDLLSNLERLLSSNACQRIASILVILANHFGKPTYEKKIIISLSLSHEDIGRLVGLTRETTSVEMKKLMNKNYISYKRRSITINNLKKLQLQCPLT